MDFHNFLFVGFSICFSTNSPNFIIFLWELSTPERKNKKTLLFLHIGNHKNIHNFSNFLWIFIIFFCWIQHICLHKLSKFHNFLLRTLYARVKKNEKRIKTFITLRILYGFSQFFFCWIQNIFLDKLSKFHNFLLRTLYARAKNEKRIKTFITLRIVYGFSQFFFCWIQLIFLYKVSKFHNFPLRTLYARAKKLKTLLFYISEIIKTSITFRILYGFS